MFADNDYTSRCASTAFAIYKVNDVQDHNKQQVMVCINAT